MHRSLLVLAALSFIACKNEDPAALYADVSYQVRCLDCEPRVGDSPRRDLAVVDGEMDTELRCESVGGRVSLEIINPEYSFEVLNTRLGDDPGDQCQVRVKEGTGQEYRGTCKPLESESDAPCEVELTADGSGFTGKVLCRKIPHQNNQSLFRYVVSPGTDDEPAEVVAQGCTGL